MQERLMHPDTLTGRPGRPEDVANAMLWLCSPAGGLGQRPDHQRPRRETTPGIGSARARLVPAAGDATRVRVAVDVTLAPDTGVAADPTGMLAGEGLAGFPVIWRSETGGLRFILNGGAGVFTDGNPWFGNPDAFTLGNPLVQDPSAGAGTGDRIAWFEQWIEAGIAGAVQLGGSNAAVYGALTAIAPYSAGQDIFRDDTRSTVDVEKAYAGIVWSDPARELSFNLSLGRQNFTLNDGFLISQFGSQWNAGPRPGIYMAPRTTHDFAAVGTVKAGDWTVTGFYLDPNEYEPFESDTTVAGANLRYNFTESFFADASVFTVPESKTRYAAPTGPVGTREGLTTYAAHVRWADRERAPGLWVEGEIAHQRHSDFDMDAWAGYATVGYLARDLPWTPSLSYRVSGFTGDDPSTRHLRAVRRALFRRPVGMASGHLARQGAAAREPHLAPRPAERRAEPPAQPHARLRPAQRGRAQQHRREPGHRAALLPRSRAGIAVRDAMGRVRPALLPRRRRHGLPGRRDSAMPPAATPATGRRCRRSFSGPSDTRSLP
jgi:hypothetical protein